MTRSRLELALALGLLFAILSIHVSSPAPALAVEGGTVEQHSMAEDAIAQFVRAGLSLPPVVVEFVGPSLEPCGGARAKTHLDRDPHVVSVCWGDPYVLLHELAHVWIFRTASDEQRVAFMGLREDVRAWAASSDGWEDQGREHAANVIAWGLMENPIVVSRTYPNDRASLVSAFKGLTGIQPIHTSGGEPALMDRSSFSSHGAESLESGR
jgi:hypothetical protein